MAAFYSLPEWVSLSVSMAAAVCTIMQAMALVYMLARDRKKDTVRIWDCLLYTSRCVYETGTGPGGQR